MKIGMIGLGKMGCALAKAIKTHTQATVIGYDISPTALNKARLAGAVDQAMDEKALKECDMVFIALPLDDTIRFIKQYANGFGKDAVIVDCCGVKDAVCEPLHDFCYSKKMWFIGGHPLVEERAAKYDYADNSLIERATMILTPYTYIPGEIVEKTKEFCLAAGFGRVFTTTPAEHDKIYAYAGQLPQLLAGAYMQSPTAQNSRDFSGRSFCAISSAALLEEEAAADLFLHNSLSLCRELELFIGHLQEYHAAIEQKDSRKLQQLLQKGREQAEALNLDCCD
jgi:prephenate dehydrogenase